MDSIDFKIKVVDVDGKKVKLQVCFINDFLFYPSLMFIFSLVEDLGHSWTGTV